jgi:thermitase
MRCLPIRTPLFWLTVATALLVVPAADRLDREDRTVALVQARKAIDHRQVVTSKRASRQLGIVVSKTRTAPASATAPRVPNDPLVAESWALQKIGAPLAWQSSRGDPSIVIAVLDTGVDASHPDLQGALVPGIDLVNDDAAPDDDFGHGTLVTGLIAARGDNGLGSAGVCWRCSVLPVKVIGSDGQGTTTDVAEGIRFAIDHGARVINLSVVLSGDDAAVAAAVAEAVARDVVVVAASGNASNADPVHPAAYPGVISVGASDDADVPYAWSGHGSWVAVTAPGCGAATTRAAGYGTFCGTSAATAIVSGVVGLVLAAHPSITTAALAAAIESSARPIGSAAAFGRVDAAAALQALSAR